MHARGRADRRTGRARPGHRLGVGQRAAPALQGSELSPPDLHADLQPYAWLLGQWQGAGHGDYPSIEKFSFGQEVAFAHDGRPFLHYVSRSWIVDDAGERLRPGGLETGFLRPRPDNGCELVLAHHTGFAEIWYGTVDGHKIELTTDVVARTESAKEVTAGHRLYGLVEGDLLWTYDMAAQGHQLQSHLWGRLVRPADRPGSDPPGDEGAPT